MSSTRASAASLYFEHHLEDIQVVSEYHTKTGKLDPAHCRHCWAALPPFFIRRHCSEMDVYKHPLDIHEVLQDRQVAL